MTAMPMPVGRGGIFDLLRGGTGPTFPIPRGIPSFPSGSSIDDEIVVTGQRPRIAMDEAELSGVAGDMALPEAPQKRGIFDRIKAGLKDPEMRAALLRSGATTLSTGDIGGGILAGAQFMDGRKRLRAEEERAAKEYALRERGVVANERRTDADIVQGDRRINIDQQQANQTGMYQQGQLTNQRYGIDVDSSDKRYGVNVGAETTRRGQDISYQSNALDNETTRRGQDISYQSNALDNETTRRGQDISYRANQDDNAVALRGQDLSSSGGNSMPPPQQARGILDSITPIVARGIPGFDDPKNFGAAMQANPELYGAATDAAAAGYQRGGTSGAIQAVQGILSQYRYKPFHDGWFSDTPAAFERNPNAGGEVRYGPDGRAYRRGPNGEAVPVN